MGYSPQESLENTINTMGPGTLLGVHLIVPWKSLKTITTDTHIASLGSNSSITKYSVGRAVYWFFGCERDLVSHHSYGWWLKSCTSWYGKYPIIYRVSYIPGGARFQPSTVVFSCKQHRKSHENLRYPPPPLKCQPHTPKQITPSIGPCLGGL